MYNRISRNDIHRDGKPVIRVPYCAAQSLLAGMQPIGFNAGVYGWNYDVYAVGNALICTGYRNMPGKKALHLREYEIAARALPVESRNHLLMAWIKRETMEA